MIVGYENDNRRQQNHDVRRVSVDQPLAALGADGRFDRRDDIQPASQPVRRAEAPATADVNQKSGGIESVGCSADEPTAQNATNSHIPPFDPFAPHTGITNKHVTFTGSDGTYQQFSRRLSFHGRHRPRPLKAEMRRLLR